MDLDMSTEEKKRFFAELSNQCPACRQQHDQCQCKKAEDRAKAEYNGAKEFLSGGWIK